MVVRVSSYIHMLIHRQASIVHIEVILSELILHVKARVLADGIQEQNMFVFSIYSKSDIVLFIFVSHILTLQTVRRTIVSFFH